MAISLNNHESRIKALENGGSSSWSRGENTNGCWLKDTKTGALIMWSKGVKYGYGNFSLPLSYSNTNTFSAIATRGGNAGWTPQIWDMVVTITSKNSIHVSCGEGNAYQWLTIGYLISDRILNYAHACKSLLFTPLRKQLEV